MRTLRLLLPLAGAALAACSTTPYDPDLPEPGTVLIRDLDPVRQRASGECGPACLATVLAAWEEPAALADLVRACPPKPGGGVTAAALRDEAKRRGLHAFVVRATLDEVERHVAQGRPLIVGVIRRSLFHAWSHYEVVAGLHRERGYVVLIDPSAGWIRQPTEAFLEEWSRAGRILIVVAK